MRSSHEDEHDKRIAVARLHLLGRNQSEIHRETGIARDTVRRWVNKDGEFQRILLALRDEVHRETAGAVAEILPDAFQVVAEAIKGGDVKVAMQLLTASGALQTGGRVLGMDTVGPRGSGAAEGVRIVVNVGGNGESPEPTTIDVDSTTG